MIHYKDNLKNNVVEICIDGKITPEDFEQTVAKLKVSLQLHGKLRLIEEVHSCSDIKSFNLLKDLLFGMSPKQDFTHAAIVTDARWMKTYVGAIDRLLQTEVKTFKSSEIDRARAWISNS